MGGIIGIPPSKWEYEFMAVKPRGDGNFDWVANYENYPEKNRRWMYNHP